MKQYRLILEETDDRAQTIHHNILWEANLKGPMEVARFNAVEQTNPHTFGFDLCIYEDPCGRKEAP